MTKINEKSLVKEIVKQDTILQVTEYGTNGKIKSFLKSGYGNTLRQDFFYDSKDRVVKILEEEYDRDHNEEKRLKVYEYNGEDYRILTYLTHKRIYDDATSAEYILDGIKTWHPVDKLISVEEAKFKGSDKIFESYHNLVTNEHSEKTFPKQAKDTQHSKTEVIDGSTNSYVETHLSEGSKAISTYENGLLRKTEVYHTFNDEEYLSFRTIYTYDGNGNRCKTEKFGRFASKMILYKIVEETKSHNALETTIKEKSYFEMFAGYYDLKLMLESNDESHGLNENSFDCDYDFCVKTVEQFDLHGNVINRMSVDPRTGEFVDKYLYHFEYNEQGLIEFEVKFKQSTETGDMENIGVKKYYYQ